MSRGTPRSKIVDAIDLVLESLVKPDHELRVEASKRDCLDDLLSVRDMVEQLLRDERSKHVQ